MASPSGSAPALALIVPDDRVAQLRDDAFMVIDKEPNRRHSRTTVTGNAAL
jgi:hypothetical protein